MIPEWVQLVIVVLVLAVIVGCWWILALALEDFKLP